MQTYFVLLALSFAAFVFVFFFKHQSFTKQLAAARIKHQTDKLRVAAMLESIGDGVIATDKDGTIIFMNHVAAEVLSWKPEMVGKRLSDVSLLADEAGHHVPIEKHPLHLCLETKERVVVKDFHFIKENKFNLAVYISATPILIGDKAVGAIEVFRDITNEKEIDRAKTEFVYLASHQLRTPLATINWYLELLIAGDAGPINEDQKKYLQEAYESNHRMVALVNEILDVSRLDLGTMSVKAEAVDLSKLAEDSTREIAPLIEKKKLTLTKKFDPKLPAYQTDPKLLRMVFQNLLTNAVKYTPENGTVTVTVKKDHDNISMTVQDTGYGIPADDHGKIFSKLFRADNIKEKEPAGTGLGLYVVKSVVEQLGGTISFASPPEGATNGTAFYVTLPLKKKKTKKNNIFMEEIKEAA